MIKLTDFPSFQDLENIESSGCFFDTQELTDLNSTLIRTLRNLKEVSRELTKYEREKVVLETEYKHTYRQTLLSSSAKTESSKKLMAELTCEELESKIMFYEEVIKELTRMSSNLRMDLDILKTLSYNLRQEMKL